MNYSSLRSISGTTTLANLFVINLIWAITLLTIFEINNSLTLRSSTLSQLKANREAIRNSMLASINSESTINFDCSNSYANYKKGYSFASTCFLASKFESKQLTAKSIAGINFIESTPQFAFNKLLSQVKACHNISNTKYDKSYFGTSLSVNSSVWPMTCLHIDTITDKANAYLSNLALNSPLQILPNPMIDSYMIATSGYLEINSTLLLNSDLIIVAGGDVIIKNLKTSLNKAPRISIFSSTGSVTIKNIEGSLSLTTYGWLGSQIVGNYIEQSTQLLPQINTHLTLSIGR